MSHLLFGHFWLKGCQDWHHSYHLHAAKKNIVEHWRHKHESDGIPGKCKMHVKNNKYMKANENIPPLHVSKQNKTNDRNKITKTNKESWKSKRIFFFVRKAMPIWPSRQFRLNENKNDFLLLTVKHVKHIHPSSDVVYKITFFKQEGVDRSDNCKNSNLSAIFFFF